MLSRLTLIARCLDRHGQRLGARSALTDCVIDLAIRRHYRAPQNYRAVIRLGKQLLDHLNEWDTPND